MIVVDTNLIGYLYLEGPHAQQAEAVLNKDTEWVAPLLWRSEFRSVLALYLRKQLLSFSKGQQIMDEALQLMDEHEYEVESQQVLRLVMESRCSAYDCEFVALAQQLGVPLVTEDKQILRDFPAIALSIERFLGAQVSDG